MKRPIQEWQTPGPPTSAATQFQAQETRKPTQCPFWPRLDEAFVVQLSYAVASMSFTRSPRRLKQVNSQPFHLPPPPSPYLLSSKRGSGFPLVCNLWSICKNCRKSWYWADSDCALPQERASWPELSAISTGVQCGAADPMLANPCLWRGKCCTFLHM